MSFPLFQLCRCLFGFPPPLSPLSRLWISGFRDARSDQHFSGTTTSQCQHFYDMLCVFFCTFIHILIINRERKQNLSVQVILWLSTWPWLVLKLEWENFCSRENTGNQSELRAPSAAWESLLSTFSDFPEDFRAAGIHLGYSHGADNLEAELSIDTALSDRASELWERRFWINPEWQDCNGGVDWGWSRGWGRSSIRKKHQIELSILSKKPRWCWPRKRHGEVWWFLKVCNSVGQVWWEV